MTLTWSFYQIWNESLEEGRPETIAQSRDYIWASEIGGAFVDRYLKMNGTQPTNPPNKRSLRKFEAGNMIEWVVELVLRRAGILQDVQKYATFQYDGLLPVSGRLDFVAGGKTDWERAEAEIHELNLPEFFGRATEKIISHFKEKFPDGLKEIILEIKSCSSFMFDRYEQYGLQTSKQHVMQTFHYLKATDMPEAHIVYICKDDLRMLEFGVMNPSDYEAWYKEDIKTMSLYYNSKERPPLEPEVVFNDDTLRFSTNWKVEYSQYLSLLYKYQEPTDYRARWDREIEQFNRTYTRCITDCKMTDLNKQTIEKIMKLFPNFYELVELGKKKKGGNYEVD